MIHCLKGIKETIWRRISSGVISITQYLLVNESLFNKKTSTENFDIQCSTAEGLLVNANYIFVSCYLYSKIAEYVQNIYQKYSIPSKNDKFGINEINDGFLGFFCWGRWRLARN